MALSIRNERAEQLAREVSAETGETMTQAIVNALEEKMERLKGRRTITNLAQEIMVISQRCRNFPDQDKRSSEKILGYDSSGAIGHGH